MLAYETNHHAVPKFGPEAVENYEPLNFNKDSNKISVPAASGSLSY